MGNVTFMVTRADRGNVLVIGPVTGISYVITSRGTPVHNVDVPGLLKMVGDPCCGHKLPFNGKVKLFGVTSASAEQVKAIPEHVLNWKQKQKVKEVLPDPPKVEVEKVEKPKMEKLEKKVDREEDL